MRLVVAALAALAVAAAGCGGVENEPSLAQAAERTEAAGSFAFETTSRFVEAGEEPLEQRCSGAIDYVLRRTREVCDDVITWLTIGGSTYFDDGMTEGRWWKVPADAQEAPAELVVLDALQSAARETRRVGEEDVRGVATDHFALSVACEASELYECEDETTVADVWTDDEGLVRRARIDEGGLTITVEYFDHGKPVDIEPPVGDQVVEPIDEPCGLREAGPIDADEGVQAFRGRGFDVQVDAGLCSFYEAASFSTNLADGSMSDHDNLVCSVYPRPLGVSSASLRGKPPVIDRRLENLECTLWVEGQDANAEDAIDRLDAALADLKRDLPPK